MQALEVVGEAHALGIVHRDLKPENLFVVRRPDGRKIIKVMDFGISKLVGQSGAPSSSPPTSSHALLGSPYYMSPEQVQRSSNVDARTDIWSLGVVLYELLTGQPPFQGPNTLKILQRIMSEPAPPMRTRRIGVPEELERVIHTCLQRDRERRFEHAGELARALLPFGSSSSHHSFDAVWGVIRNQEGAGAADPNSAAGVPPSSSGGDATFAGAATAPGWPCT
jgi:serine/threonine-protein kinase